MSNLTSKAWWAAAGTRAIKTAAQGLVALLGANVVGVTAYDWPKILGILVAMIIASLATSLAGLPEVATDSSTSTPSTAAVVAVPVTVAPAITATAQVDDTAAVAEPTTTAATAADTKEA